MRPDLVFRGALIPVFVFPEWLELASKIAIPTTLGVEATRQTLIDGASLSQEVLPEPALRVIQTGRESHREVRSVRGPVP